MSERAARTILVVEDNDLSRKLTRSALVGAGFAVVEASDGRSALASVEATPIDLVLLDIRLPDMDGFDVADRIRERLGGVDVPIVVCSALPGHGDHARGIRARVSDYLLKPVSPSEIVTIVRSYLPEQPSAVTGARYRVLIVDDEPAQRKLTSILLGAEGYDIVTAADGHEALDVARRLTPDAIVADVLMPRLDGFRFCSAVREDVQLSHVPVILCSNAYTEPSDAELARRVGAHALVDTAADQRHVVSALEAALLSGAAPQDDGQAAPVIEPYLARVTWQLERQLSSNAQLLGRLAIREAELSILGQAAQLVTRGVRGAQTLEELLHACLNAAGLSRGAVHLFGPDGVLSLKAALGYTPAQRPVVGRFFRSMPLLRAIAEGSESVLVPGTLSAVESEPILRAAGLRGMLLAPIRSGGEGLGVLWMGSDAREIDRDWGGFAAAVASQVGHAVLLERAITGMADAERRYRSVFEGVGVGLFQLTPHGLLTLANPALSRSLGFESPAQLVMHQPTFSALFAHPAQGLALLERAATAAETAELEGRHRSGETLWLRVTIAPIKDAAGATRYFDGVASDVTDQRRLQQLSTVEQTQRMQMQIKDQFLSQVSHELRTPLAAMHQYVTILLDGLAGEIADGQREHLETILRNAVQLRAMIDDLLEVSRAEGSTLAIHAQRATVDELIHSAVDTFAATAREKRIALHAELVPGLPSVFADPSRVMQILVNLVGNALKFTPVGGLVTVRAALPDAGGQFVSISVSDTGLGIPAAERDRVFDYLYQGQSEANATRRGFGIGLYVCRDLVERQGGRIWLESTPGRGTTFFFTLPCEGG